MSDNNDEKTKAKVMSKTAKLNEGQVPKGSVAAAVQEAVDEGKDPNEGKSKGMANEGKQTGGKYSKSTGAAQSEVDKADQGQ